LRHRGIAIFVLVLFLLTGLTVYYYDAYHRLSFELVGLSLGSLGSASGVATCTVKIGNPSLLPVYVPSGDASVHVNGLYLGRGHFGSLTISGGATGILAVPIGFNFSDVLGVVSSVVATGGKATVALDGSAHLILFDVPFSTILYNTTLG
jgi:LEA14-like dessication related protein